LSTDVQFSSSGQAMMSSSMPLGNPQVLGCLVTPVSSVLANQQAAMQFLRLEAAAIVAG
jgi:hypothetical protein